MFPWLKTVAAYQSQITELQQKLDAAIAANEAMQKHAYIVDIDRPAGSRVNKFLFVRNSQMHVIETMGLMSDDIAQWKKDLLE